MNRAHQMAMSRASADAMFYDPHRQRGMKHRTGKRHARHFAMRCCDGCGGVVGVGFVVESGKIEMHNWDGLIIKLDAGGAELWRRTIGGSRRDEFTGVVAASDGSMFVAGYTGSQGQDDWAPWLMHLSSTGELMGEAKRDLELRQK